jgi:class 3 adenylate cyclase
MTTAALPVEALTARVARNFFTHSGHVPLVLLILEALLARPGYFARPDAYLLVGAGLAQAWISELFVARGAARPVLANLAGPLIYTVAETLLEGGGFFLQWHHQAYWAYGVVFALLQSARPSAAVVLAENVLRSSIPLVMYALFEARMADTAPSVRVFFADLAHSFLAVVLLLLGMLLGFADISLRRSMTTIAALTARLRQYSQWTLGSGLLDRAIADERVLSLQRVQRAVLFMDIRGFTAWSEAQTPEQVVALLHRYYRAADEAAAPYRPVKLKYTADEVMIVFADAPAALHAGAAMLRAASQVLAEAGLGAGCGVHQGLLVEGVLGGEGSKAYDFIGDTVNTAQRLCDAAGAGELLASVQACAAAQVVPGEQREVLAKGKRAPVLAAVLPV